MISILIPIYNGIEFISQSVGSILAQTFTEWEIIIGINGHEKNSEIFNIAYKYTLVSNKIKVIDLYPIRGKSNALNEMIKYSIYDWVALLDVDDTWVTDKLEKQIAYINDYDVIGGKCQYFGKEENNGVIPPILLGDISNEDFFLGNPVINSSCLIKKKYCLWEPECIIEDYDLWLRLRYLTDNIKFFNIDEVLIYHRIHDTSAFNNVNHDLVPNLLEKYKDIIEISTKQNKDNEEETKILDNVNV